eukprot:g17570.t1
MCALLLLAPHLEQAIFILQRLLISESWLGPLYLVLLSGSLSREELQHHPLLQPLIEGFAENFLKDMHCFSHQDWTQGPNRHTSTLLQEIVSEVHRKTGGEKVLDATSDMDAACVALEPVPRQPSLLRTLGRVLAFGGRLVTSSSSMEMSPEDAQHFWAKECSISFFNPHCVPLAMLRHGELLHAAADVCGRIAAGELCIVDSAVAQFYLFDQFQQALDAASHQQGVRKYSGEASGAQLEEFERLEGAPVQVDSDSPARTKRKRTPSIDLDPVLGNWPAEEQMSEAAREEVEQMWARCLRGEELWDELAGDSTDEAYHLHALHSLLQEFRRAPAAFIKETFAKA